MGQLVFSQKYNYRSLNRYTCGLIKVKIYRNEKDNSTQYINIEDFDIHTLRLEYARSQVRIQVGKVFSISCFSLVIRALKYIKEKTSNFRAYDSKICQKNGPYSR